MTRADRVHSTPSTNASALPVDTTRRGFLAQAAAAAAGGATLGASLPLPVSAGDAERVLDPIHAAIDMHRHAVAAHDAATNVRAAFNDINMNDEQRTQLAALMATVDVAGRRRHQPG